MNKNSGNIRILYLQLNPDSSPIVRHETWTTLGSSSQELGLAGTFKGGSSETQSLFIYEGLTPLLNKKEPNSSILYLDLHCQSLQNHFSFRGGKVKKNYEKNLKTEIGF